MRKIWEAISRPEYSETLRDDVSSKLLAGSLLPQTRQLLPHRALGGKGQFLEPDG